MKEIKSIVEAYKTIDFFNTKAALATVSRVEGSSYRRMGARMLVLDNGTYLGGISGGCLEGDALRRAQKAIVQNKPSVITYDTTQDDGAQIGVGLGCNGIIDVLFTPLHAGDTNNPVQILSTLTETRKPRAIVFVTDSNGVFGLLGKTLLYENDVQFLQSFALKDIAGDVLEDLHDALQNQASRTVNYEYGGEAVRIFIEIILPVTHLILYGGNYDIYPMTRIAREIGWNVTVVTNIHKADKSLFSIATKVLHNKSDELPEADAYSAIILMAHDYKTDINNLQKVINTDVRYVGLLGPRKRSEKMFKELSENGNSISEKNMERIFAPAGLDIGATTPEEIALSICAEIRSVFAGRSGVSLRLRDGTIHGN